MFSKSYLNQEPMDRMKTIGLFGRYICALYHNHDINQKKLADLTGKKPSQVSRDIKKLKALEIITVKPKKNQNILTLSPYGKDIHKIIIPYSQITNIPLTEGIKDDLIEIFNEFIIDENDILKNHNFEKVKSILKVLPVSEWDDFEESDKFINTDFREPFMFQ